MKKKDRIVKEFLQAAAAFEKEIEAEKKIIEEDILELEESLAKIEEMIQFYEELRRKRIKAAIATLEAPEKDKYKALKQCEIWAKELNEQQVIRKF